MTTNEVFETIIKSPTFKDYPNSRVIKFRHNKGVLSHETYKQLFLHFGYTGEINWKNNENSN